MNGEEPLNSVPKSGRKVKKKTAVIIAVVCFAIALGCGITAAVLKTQKSAAPDGTNISGISREWKKASSNFKGAPDTTVKAAFIRKLKKESPKTVLTEFDILKVYSDFRIYDVQVKESGKVQKYIMVLYIKDSKATAFFVEEYSDSAERADKLTSYIKGLDKDYEKYAKQAQAITDESSIFYQ